MPSIESIQAKVQRILLAELGEVQIDEDLNFKIPFEDTMCFVTVGEGLGEVEVVVRVEALVLRNVKLTTDVFEWVATEGQEFQIGGTCIWRDAKKPDRLGAIMFCYGIAADDLDSSELRLAVGCVGVSANMLSEALKPRFGGETFFEES